MTATATTSSDTKIWANSGDSHFLEQGGATWVPFLGDRLLEGYLEAGL